LYSGVVWNANLLKTSLVTTAAVLAICLLALVDTTNTAEAASLPQNGKIVFGRIPSSGGGNVYTVDPDGSSLNQLTNNENYPGGQPAWSPDGTKIAYVSAGHITVMDADGSNKRSLPLHGRHAHNSDPAWSADGTRLAFSSEGLMQANADIYTIAADGSVQTNLTNSPGVAEGSPDFSPNGSQMCFDGGNTKIGFGIYVMSSNASDPARLANDRAGVEGPARLHCDWSPDGTKIAYTNYQERRGGEWSEDVYVMNADGSRKINLTSPSAREWHPRWSPDGTKIVFASDRDGDFDIYTMEPDGSNVTQVTTNSSALDLDADWQPLPGPQATKSRGLAVHPPDTGGPSLLLAASVLLFSGSVLLYAVVRHGM
jgi:Tol biopolymer transport system component